MSDDGTDSKLIKVWKLAVKITIAPLLNGASYVASKLTEKKKEKPKIEVKKTDQSIRTPQSIKKGKSIDSPKKRPLRKLIKSVQNLLKSKKDKKSQTPIDKPTSSVSNKPISPRSK